MGLSIDDKIQALQGQITSMRQQIVALTKPEAILNRVLMTPDGELFYCEMPDGSHELLLTPPSN